ncbi:MAG: DNA-binding protein WhiA [Firmicutes bacterium]|nr:DNA-binding protein WhiA [Bacillota bacterium]
MGFCENAKIEMAAAPLRSRRAKAALLSAYARSAGVLQFNGGFKTLVLKADILAVKTLLSQLLHDLYGGGAGCIEEGRNTFAIGGAFFEKVTQDLKIFKFSSEGALYESGISEEFLSEPAAYLRGLFLGAGAVTLSGGYHFEISFLSGILAQAAAQLLSKAKFKTACVMRKDKTVLYIKNSEKVGDALAYLGATKAMLAVNEVFVSRAAAVVSNRRTNCDLANIDKTVSASGAQMQAIALLQNSKKLDKLSLKLKETAALRLANPEATLSELAELAGVSRSGMRHRLEKLIQEAGKK